MQPKSKTCNTCHIEKPLIDFHTNKGMRGNRQPYCKKCGPKILRAWRLEKRKQVQELLLQEMGQTRLL